MSLSRRALLAAVTAAGAGATLPFAFRRSQTVPVSTTSVLDGLEVHVYGHSIAAWNDEWGWAQRMQADHNWVLTNGAEWSSRSVDAVGQMTAFGSPVRIDYGNRPQVVIIDAAANDLYGVGQSGADNFERHVLAAAAWATLEGAIAVDNPALSWPSNWTRITGHDFVGLPAQGTGANRTAPAGATATLPGFGRSGRWAFFWYSLAPVSGVGGSWSLFRDGGQALGNFSCDQGTINPQAWENRAYTPTGRGPRNWGLHGAVVAVPATTDFTIRSDGGGGGPFFTAYGKVNESTEQPAPLVVLVPPVHHPHAANNTLVDSYGARLAYIAAQLPNVVVAPVLTGWDATRMTRRGDELHPNARGCQHYQQAIEAAVDQAVDGGWLPNTNLDQ